MTQYIQNKILSYYEKIISAQFKNNAPKLKMDQDGETVHIYYPSVVNQKSKYISDSIRLEFGGRNLTIPNNLYTIKPDISEHLNTLEFPKAQITVLSPQKTFWEKVTLIHYECNRPILKNDANRISRHWYDIAMLINHDIGIQAIENRELLNEVIKIKKTFYDSGYAKYDDCLNGKFILIPESNHLKLLQDDFNKMLDEKMFYGEQPNFNWVIEQISNLEEKING